MFPLSSNPANVYLAQQQLIALNMELIINLQATAKNLSVTQLMDIAISKTLLTKPLAKTIINALLIQIVMIMQSRTTWQLNASLQYVIKALALPNQSTI